MNPFLYVRPTTIDAAVTEFALGLQGEALTSQFIAGGTNLLDLMKQDVEHPTKLVDINRLPLTTIKQLPDGGLRLGALVTNADTAYHPLVQERYPMLAKAILAGASPQLRNKATNGGNLFQRTRCYYFYDPVTPCNKREPGSGCGAIDGFNRIHAILGTSDKCIATHPSDMCVALVALKAVIQVTGPNGDRTVGIEDFHRLPGDEPWRDNNIQPGELVTAIDLPPDGFADHYAYLKLRDRKSYAFALVSVAVGLELDSNSGNQITAARISLGGVAHKPWHKSEAEAMLISKAATQQTCHLVADVLLEGAQGFGYNTFKIELARLAIVRALGIATGQNE